MGGVWGFGSLERDWVMVPFLKLTGLFVLYITCCPSCPCVHLISLILHQKGNPD